MPLFDTIIIYRAACVALRSIMLIVAQDRVLGLLGKVL